MNTHRGTVNIVKNKLKDAEFCHTGGFRFQFQKIQIISHIYLSRLSYYYQQKPVKYCQYEALIKRAYIDPLYW